MTDEPRPVSISAYGRPTNPRIMVLSFLILTFTFSTIYWYQIIVLPPVPANATFILVFTVLAMWSPAMAAIITRLFYQRNLRGFGFRPGQPKWLLLGILLPVAIGLLIFGLAWLSGIAPFNAKMSASLYSLAFLPLFAMGFTFNLIAAAGEEIGWRGLVVPELSRMMGFTKLALLSSALWAAWYIPMIIFGIYRSTGPIWYSLVVLIPALMGAGLILAWLRLMSGSIWPSVLFHGFWYYFTQQFYLTLTVTTPGGKMMLGMFGWLTALVCVLLALVFWYFHDRLPALPVESAAAEKPIPGSGDTPPAPPDPASESDSRRKMMLAIGAGALLVIAISAGVMMYGNFLPSFGGSRDAGTEGMPSPLLAPPPEVTSAQESQGPVQVPPAGVWVRVTYPGSFTGTVGTAADQRPVTGSGDAFYVIPTSTGVVKAVIQKTDGSGQELTVEVYKDGTLAGRRSTTVPVGIIEIQVSLKSIVTKPATTA